MWFHFSAVEGCFFWWHFDWFARMSWCLWSSCIDFSSLIIIRYQVYKLCQETASWLALLMNYCSSGQTAEKTRHWLLSSVPLCLGNKCTLDREGRKYFGGGEVKIHSEINTLFKTLSLHCSTQGFWTLQLDSAIKMWEKKKCEG